MERSGPHKKRGNGEIKNKYNKKERNGG